MEMFTDLRQFEYAKVRHTMLLLSSLIVSKVISQLLGFGIATHF